MNELEKNEYLESKNIKKDFDKYEVLTVTELFNYAFGSFEKSDGFDFGDFFDYIDPNVIKEYKESGTAQLLYNEFLELDQGVYYNAEESFTDFYNDLYILKCTENVIM